MSNTTDQFAIQEMKESDGWAVAKKELISLCAEMTSVGNAKDWADVLGANKAIELIGEWFSKLDLIGAEEIRSGITAEHLRYFEE